MEIIIQNKIIIAMRNEIHRAEPNEACGLISEKHGRQFIYPVQNISNSQHTFIMDPQELIDALMDIRNRSSSIFGIYHSHPEGPRTPSRLDLDRDVFLDINHLIWSKDTGEWKLWAYRYSDDGFKEIGLRIND